jgi:hypothetical protein
MSFSPIARVLWCLAVLCGAAVHCLALDREAFSFQNYDLNLQIDPAQHRLGVRGKIKLRNDTASPQKIAALQISSSLDWRSIKAGGREVQFVTQSYTSDIDHTGALSEAIVTLPEAVASHGTVELDVAYEGVITRDATRLTRIETPEDIAKSTDWDAIDARFTGLRGAAYVAWYPIATEVANLSQGNSMPEVLTRWSSRELGSTMHLKISLQRSDETPPQVLLNGIRCNPASTDTGDPGISAADCASQSLRLDAPTLVIADYEVMEKDAIEVRLLPEHQAAANSYAEAAAKVMPLVQNWFGAQREKAKVAQLPDREAAPFESGAWLLTPLTGADSGELTAAHQLTHASFLSFRPWIEEGLAHFAQALVVEQQHGRKAALDYMSAHRAGFVKLDEGIPSGQEDQADRSLVNTTRGELYRSKAMSVWWMLRDMIGDSALKKAIAAYRPEQDKEPSYMARLIASQTQRDLEWFFDDWLYRDRGLPDFKVESAYSRRTMTNGFLLTVTLDNLGAAGAEVPVVVRFAGGETAKRLEVRGKSKATIRVETPAVPQEITVNDGSVPESDTMNNTVKVEAPQN